MHDPTPQVAPSDTALSASSPTVCVIIAAKDAAATIATAVRSALREAEVARVVVVDDGSSDDTAGEAKRAADGDRRLDLIRLETNRGPSLARNRALDRAKEDFVAILDADDFLVPGRFTRLFAETGWDIAADDIAFVREDSTDFARGPDHILKTLATRANASRPSYPLAAGAFIEGNISRRGKARGELGFLKPVIRRSLLGIGAERYNEAVRLGEDYDLYARLLIKGARFRIVPACGYVAIERPNSLSGRHSTADLEQFIDVDTRLLARGDLDSASRTAISAHRSQTRKRWQLRRFLDEKKERGLANAALRLFIDPLAWPAVVVGIGRDKADAVFRSLRPDQPQDRNRVRYLFS